MQVDSIFRLAISDLLKKYEINEPMAGAKDHDVFILSVEGLDIYLIGRQKHYLNLACAAGKIPKEATRDTFLALLGGNLFSLEHPVLSVGVNRETREVILSTRQPLSELNSVAMFRLAESFIEQAIALRSWLKG